jgi:hypothetical protein
MIKISKKEDIIFKQIKVLNLEYDEGIPENILKMELELYKDELNEILNELKNKNIISYENNKIKINKEKTVELEETAADEEVKEETAKEETITEETKTNEEIKKETANGKTITEKTKTNEETKVEIEIDDELKEELNEKEKETIKIIQNLMSEDKTVSKHTLEGELLYGELKLSNFSMYHVLLSLENNKIIRKNKKVDGDYYRLII